jgi:hypothetical protein
VLGREIRHGAIIRNDNAFLPKKEQRIMNFVGEPNHESNGINARRESGEQWRAINRRDLLAV